MTELDDDFNAQDEINPFNNEQKDPQTCPPNTTDFIGPNYADEEDDDLNTDTDTNKPPQRIRELDDSGDELEENEKQKQRQFKQNFNNLFANSNNIDDNDCVIKEEIESKEYNQEMGEQKMEPFNLREERGEGWFDQFLNYHKTNKEEIDPFYEALDGQSKKHNRLSAETVRKHKRDYANYEKNTKKSEIDLLNEWKSLLPLFANNTDSIAQTMQILSKAIKENEGKSERCVKKRKLNNGKSEMSVSKHRKKKRNKRVWESESESKASKAKDKTVLSEREVMGYKRKFEILSEKATVLFGNGDHNIYEQTRDLLIQRIKLVENGERPQKKSKGRGKDVMGVKWEYYWKNDKNKEIHGPFDRKQMTEWTVHFAKQAIMFRKVNGKEWTDSDTTELITVFGTT